MESEEKLETGERLESTEILHSFRQWSLFLGLFGMRTHMKRQ